MNAQAQLFHDLFKPKKRIKLRLPKSKSARFHEQVQAAIEFYSKRGPEIRINAQAQRKHSENAND